MDSLSDWAVDLSRQLLAEELPQRFAHVEGAIVKARAFAPVAPGDEDLLVAAVAVHDLGFASPARDTGMSTLDAARYLRSEGAPARLVDLVAHQCMGAVEAEVRGFGEHWTEFGPDEAGAVRDAMWTSCLTTAIDGSTTTVAQRCEEWKGRYNFDWLTQYLLRARADLEAAEQRTLERMAAAG